MKTPQALQMTTFASPQQQLALTVLYTASQMLNRHRTLLKPLGITPEQFNILRILRGQKGNPIALRDISGRMIDRNSNTSRLIDKLVDKTWSDAMRVQKIAVASTNSKRRTTLV